MKFIKLITISLAFSSEYANSTKLNNKFKPRGAPAKPKDPPPVDHGPKNNAKCPFKSFAEYARKRDHSGEWWYDDCGADEALNWFGARRCKFDWECQSTRVCDFFNQDEDPIGYCDGENDCPPPPHRFETGDAHGRVEWDAATGREVQTHYYPDKLP